MSGKVKINRTNTINEGILGVDDMVMVVPDRGFADRSIGDEFFRTGRNTGSNVIEVPDYGMDGEDMSDEEYEDMGYDYDGADEQGSDEAYPMHPTVRNKMVSLETRLSQLEDLIAILVGDDEMEDDMGSEDDSMDMEDEDY